MPWPHEECKIILSLFNNWLLVWLCSLQLLCNQTMMSTPVTNEMIYQFLQEMDGRVQRVEASLDKLEMKVVALELKFEALELKFEALELKTEAIHESLKDFKADSDRRFKYLEDRMDRLERQREEDKKLLMDVWESRDKVQLGFSRGFAMLNALATLMISGTVSYTVSR